MFVFDFFKNVILNYRLIEIYNWILVSIVEIKSII